MRAEGVATHFDVVAGDRRARQSAWSYREPNRGYKTVAGHIAFYPGRVDACYVDGELVRPQPGDYFGGWITHDMVGPSRATRARRTGSRHPPFRNGRRRATMAR